VIYQCQQWSECYECKYGKIAENKSDQQQRLTENKKTDRIFANFIEKAQNY